MGQAFTLSEAKKPENFESAVAELETIITGMEGGQLSLEHSLAAYKRGAELLQYCHTVLQNAQQQVQILEADTLQKFSITTE
jgi:exodeoxyribonuclease VII small subunit